MTASLSVAVPPCGGAEAEPTQETVARAVEWLQRLRAEQATPADVRQCRAWCAEHASHALAYGRVEALWSRFDGLDPDTSLAVLDAVTAARPPRRSRSPGKKAVVGALILMMAIVAAQYTGYALAPLDAWLADHRTATGEQRTIALEDGSQVTLNTNSAVDIEYNGSERRVHLRRGEVLVQVGKEPRPFVVTTPQGAARALGTRYLVQRGDGVTEVTVLESVVRVCAATQAAQPCVDLRAGQRGDMRAGGVANVKAADVVSAESWREGALLVDDRPLVEVLSELSRYRTGFVHFDAEKLKHLRLSGAFPLKNTDQALRVIAETQPVRIRYFTPWMVSVEPR